MWSVAKETLSSRQLAQLDVCDAEFPDAKASLIVEQILEAGIRMPEVLKVPDDYKGIYISGGLHLDFFPIFFEAGFHGINTRSRFGVLPFYFAKQPSIWDPRGWPSGNPDALLRLMNSRRLEQPIGDPQSFGLNTSATGWHYLALKMPDIDGISPDGIPVATPQPHIRDSCRCFCSPTAATP